MTHRSLVILLLQSFTCTFLCHPFILAQEQAIQVDFSDANTNKPLGDAYYSDTAERFIYRVFRKSNGNGNGNGNLLANDREVSMAVGYDGSDYWIAYFAEDQPTSKATLAFRFDSLESLASRPTENVPHEIRARLSGRRNGTCHSTFYSIAFLEDMSRLLGSQDVGVCLRAGDLETLLEANETNKSIVVGQGLLKVEGNREDLSNIWDYSVTLDNFVLERGEVKYKFDRYFGGDPPYMALAHRMTFSIRRAVETPTNFGLADLVETETEIWSISDGKWAKASSKDTKQ